MSRGAIEITDIRKFMKKLNLYPIEKDLGLLFERMDKDEDGYVNFEEFKASITPFMNNE